MDSAYYTYLDTIARATEAGALADQARQDAEALQKAIRDAQTAQEASR